MYGAVDLLIVGKYAEIADQSGVAAGSMFTTTFGAVITCFDFDYMKKIFTIGAPVALQELLAGIFSNDRAVITAAHSYLRAYAIDCLLTAMLFCFIGYFNGCERTLFVMVQIILCIMAFIYFERRYNLVIK